ncbi:hypothetical protein [Ornithinimicrobium murale]|uniref:hypothetical protein n=1 Tax=Ornithinimicrobium murale TaxID=1050153 RepID=UPI000E0D8FD8|nr:hypothetical protein [Ornithinimicrobium murale]
MSTQTFQEHQHPRGQGGQFAIKPAAEASTAVIESPSWSVRLDRTDPQDRPSSLAWTSDLHSGVSVPGSPAVFDTDEHYDVSTGHSEVRADVFVPAYSEGDQVTTPAPSGNGTLTWDVDEQDRLTLVHSSSENGLAPEDVTWSEFVGSVDDVASVPAPDSDFDDRFAAVEFEGVRLVRDEQGNPLRATARSSWVQVED